MTAHRGQVDKSGAPYILHPLRVMLSLKTEEERIVAVLHDVVEDCEEWPLERLRGEGLPERLATALESVTRNDGETYTEFIERSKTNAIGRRVKTADLRDNMDLSRIENPTEQDHKRTAKYRSALVQLGETVVASFSRRGGSGRSHLSTNCPAFRSSTASIGE